MAKQLGFSGLYAFESLRRSTRRYGEAFTCFCTHLFRGYSTQFATHYVLLQRAIWFDPYWRMSDLSAAEARSAGGDSVSELHRSVHTTRVLSSVE